MTRDWRGNPAIGEEWWRPDVDTNPQTASAVPFWMLMAFSFILLIAPQQLVPALAPLRIALVTGGVAVAVCLVDRFARREPLTVRTRELWLAGGLLTWAVLTAPLSYEPQVSVALLALYIKSLAVFWLLGNTVTTPERLRQLAWALSLMSVPLALTAAWHFVTGDFLPGGRHVTRIVGYDAALTGNPNDLALMLNLLIPFSVALALTAERSGIRALLLGVLAVDVTGIIVTFSRGGFLTLGTIFAAYVWKLRHRPERAWAWGAIVLALACLPLLPAGYLDRLATITKLEEDRTGSAQMRRDDTLAAVRMVLANPITGTGIGTNAFIMYHERAGRGTGVHNVYLEYAAELGLPGLVLFVLLLVECLKSAGRVRRRTAGVPGQHRLFALAEAIQVSLVAFAVAALFHPVAYNLFFYYMAGLAVAVKVIGGAEQPLRT